MKKVFFALAMLGALLCFSACSNSSGGGSSVTWKFINNSTHEVTVIPQGKSEFSVPVGETKTYTWSDGQCIWSWLPFLDVQQAPNYDSHVCVFSDKTSSVTP